jgi:hypothetical protein
MSGDDAVTTVSALPSRHFSKRSGTSGMAQCASRQVRLKPLTQIDSPWAAVIEIVRAAEGAWRGPRPRDRGRSPYP